MISIFELFSIGIGPSSSHTVGPMRAAQQFASLLVKQNVLPSTARIVIDLYGSLALTGIGHGTNYAIAMGLENLLPENIQPELSRQRFQTIRETSSLNLAGKKPIPYYEHRDLIFHKLEVLPFHPNGISFSAYDQNDTNLLSQTYYSVGGGFVVTAEDATNSQIRLEELVSSNPVPYPFHNAQQLINHCQQQQLSIAELMIENELKWRSRSEITAGLMKIWEVMDSCIANGLHNAGILPGGLNLPRRAPNLYQKLRQQQTDSAIAHNASSMDWLSLYAIAVNEENAAGGRVVTAPTNGAAGILPSVLKYILEFIKPQDPQAAIEEFLLTAGAMGILYKTCASISAAEVGCQGEVGVACSMAAAGYVACCGGNILQIENAAEIAMEHHLGLTCDPINGLVQIPCIERNAIGAVQAVSSGRLALLGTGEHYVSLDKVIVTMRETGRDMMSKYKETSQGGLAVNLPEC